MMLEDTMNECWTAEDHAELKSKLRTFRRENDDPLYKQCELWVSQGNKASGEPSEESAADLPFGKSTYGHTFNIDKYIKSLEESDPLSRVICSLCFDIPKDPQITDVSYNVHKPYEEANTTLSAAISSAKIA